MSSSASNLTDAQAAAVWRTLGRPTWVPVVGNSMWPLLKPGDEVLAVPLAQPAQTGELILFLLDDGLVVHRVRSARSGVYHTRGDNQCRPDPPVDPSAVLGRIVARRRGGAELRLDDRRGRRASYTTRLIARPWRALRCRLLPPVARLLRLLRLRRS